MERTLLQIAVAVAGLAGVGLGLTGVVFGTLDADLSGDVVLDSYVRFLKGMLLAMHLGRLKDAGIVTMPTIGLSE